MNLKETICAALLVVASNSQSFSANFFIGDSLTACRRAMDEICFPAQFSSNRNEFYQQVARDGAQASDIWWHLQKLQIRPADRAFYLTGTNDIVKQHLDRAYRPISVGSFAASIYWLSSRTEAVRRSGSETGEWLFAIGDLGRKAVKDGSTWMSHFDGDKLIMGYQLNDGVTSSFSVHVDGKFAGTFSHAPATKIATFHGEDFYKGAAPALLRQTGFGEGAHVIVVTAHCGPDNPSAIDWIWRGSADFETYVSTVPRMSSFAYGQIGGSDAAIDSYADEQRRVVMQANADGMNISLVDINSAINPEQHLRDGVHLGPSGTVAVTKALERAVSLRESARIR